MTIGIGGWIARYLGPQKLGTLAYVTALVGLLGPLGKLGVKGSLSSMLCEKQKLPGLLGSALLIELIGTFLIVLVLIPFAWFARDPLIIGLFAFAVLGNLLNSSEIFEVDLLNRHQGTKLARVSTIQTLAGAFFSVMVLLAQAPLLMFGILPALQAAIRAFLLAAAAQSSNLLQLLGQASWKTSRALLKRGFPLILAGLSVTIYMKSDQVILEWLGGPDDVGQYSIAVRVAESLNFLPVLLSSTFLPRIGRGVSGQFDSDSALRQFYRSSWLLGMGMLIVSIFVLPPLIPLVFGDQFLPAKLALICLAPSSFAVAISCASSAWLNTHGYQNNRPTKLCWSDH